MGVFLEVLQSVYWPPTTANSSLKCIYPSDMINSFRADTLQDCLSLVLFFSGVPLRSYHPPTPPFLLLCHCLFLLWDRLLLRSPDGGSLLTDGVSLRGSGGVGGL